MSRDTRIVFDREQLSNFESLWRREWLITNGIGGYASGTLAGMNTRRYHGLLIAALQPPTARTLMIAKMDASIRYDGQSFALGCNEYADGTVDPRGYVYLQSFRLEAQIPVWTWVCNDTLLEQRIWMQHGENSTYVSFKVLQARDVVELTLNPFCSYRDYHTQLRGRRDFKVSTIESGIQIEAFDGAHPYRLCIDNGTCEVASDWYWNFKHRIETERGLDDLEDLFRPAVFHATLRVNESATMLLTTETLSSTKINAKASITNESARQAQLLSRANSVSTTERDPLFDRLALAADQFIVERHNASGQLLGKTIIAGYPWFCDWGRDTMIALPGLTLVTQRFEDAASILRTFAQFISQGMLPNRFPDAGATPEYNTIDATLWYFIAIEEYLDASRDSQLVADLYPALRDIIDWHVRGTRYEIRVDPQDGLLYGGEDGVQLTWMDAKVGDQVITPRIGKPVEVNALWFNALTIMQRFAKLLRDDNAAIKYATMAARAKQSFNALYWDDAHGHLYDVIHGPEGEQHADGYRYDASLRPNQLFAVSLRYPLLDGERACAVVDVCEKHLYTPSGIRSLGPGPNYHGQYVGNSVERDSAYHQGTTWSWLLGPFVRAHFRVYRDAARATQFLDGIREHLRNACIGQVSEIFDGDSPFAPRGCFAQAWSVAEVFRAWNYVSRDARDTLGIPLSI